MVNLNPQSYALPGSSPARPGFASALPRPHGTAAVDRVQFGAANENPAPSPEPDKGFWKHFWHELKGPTSLGPLQRITAFFSRTNLSHGIREAKQAHRERSRSGYAGLEWFMLAMELAIGFFSMGITLGIDVLLPGAAFSDTCRRFFTGVHESAEQRLQEKQQDAPDAE